MSESMEAKIKKLLHLAERAATPGEAEAASKAAERLMLKWGIEEAVIRAKMTGKDERPEAIVVKYTAPFPKAYVKARMSLANQVVLGMGEMKAWISGGNRLAIMGFESDVDRALMFIPSILIQADHAQAAWWKAYPMRSAMTSAEGFRARRQFILSFGMIVRKRLTEMRQEEIIVADGAAGTPGTALVLRNRAQMVEDEFRNKFAMGMRKGRSMKGGTWDASAAGAAAGQNARLGGQSIGRGVRGELG